MSDIIITAIIATGIIGLLAAALLTTASKLMYVKVDPLAGKIRDALPGANCGVCGYSGCDGYAAALAENKAEINLCRPGGDALISQLSGILGVEAGEGLAKKTAVVRCIGSSGAKTEKADYTGISSCLAAGQLYGGMYACSFGCLGFGDCINICPQSAICISGGIAHIDTRKCIGCEKCVALCPRGIIAMTTLPVRAFVYCSNTEKGSVVRKKCSKGCIACSKCARECPPGAITIEDNLAVIDTDKCDGCGHCIEICMTKCINPQ